MESSKKVSLAAAVAAGYILGRTKKGKLALGVASVVVGQQLPLNPREIVTVCVRKLAESPQVAPLIEQARGEVLNAGRTALTATANRRLESLADALQQRTNALREPPGDEDEDEDEQHAAEEEEEEDEEDEGEPEDEGEEEGEDEEEEEEPPRRRRPAKRSAAKKPPAKKAPAKKSASPPAKKKPAKKTAAKKTAAKKSPPKKAAAKKASSRNSRRR